MSPIQTLRQHLNESWQAVKRDRREDDLDKLQLFARVLAHDAKVLQQELQATEEGIVKHESSEIISLYNQFKQGEGK